jgi:hypothetical protein
MFFLAAEDPTDHSKDIILARIGDMPVLTMHMLTLLLAAGLFLWLMHSVANAVATGPASDGNERYITKGRFAQLIETIICWLRDEIIQPILGERHTHRYLPFLLTVFFFFLPWRPYLWLNHHRYVMDRTDAVDDKELGDESDHAQGNGTRGRLPLHSRGQGFGTDYDQPPDGQLCVWRGWLDAVYDRQ